MKKLLFMFVFWLETRQIFSCSLILWQSYFIPVIGEMPHQVVGFDDFVVSSVRWILPTGWLIRDACKSQLKHTSLHNWIYLDGLLNITFYKTCKGLYITAQVQLEAISVASKLNLSYSSFSWVSTMPGLIAVTLGCKASGGQEYHLRKTASKCKTTDMNIWCYSTLWWHIVV